MYRALIYLPHSPLPYDVLESFDPGDLIDQLRREGLFTHAVPVVIRLEEGLCFD